MSKETDLIKQYFDAFNRQDLEGVMACFDEEAVRGWYEKYDKTARDQIRSLRHTISTPMIQVDGNQATSVCYLDADGIDSDSGRAFQVLGRYEDKLIKDEGRWWMAERAIITDGNYQLGEARESL